MEKYSYHYVITYWGTYLGINIETKELVHTDELPISNKTCKKINYRWHRQDNTLISENVSGFNIRIVDSVDERICYLKIRTRFITTLPDNHKTRMSIAAFDWEKFFIINSTNQLYIEHLSKNKWISNAGAHESCLMDKNFTLRIGSNYFKIIDQANFLGEPCPQDIYLIQDGWILRTYRMFKPCVYYVAFGTKALDELTQSIYSLVHHAKYTDNIIIYGDTQTKDYTAFLNEEHPNNILYSAAAAFEFVDFCAVRWEIANCSIINDFCPILYADTDIIFDQDIRQILTEIRLSDELCVGMEPDHYLATRESVGSQLFNEAGVVLSDEIGFNSGIFGIPALSRFTTLMKLVSKTIYNYALTKNGSDSLSHFDQSVANYVSHHLGTVNVKILSKYIRWMQNDQIRGGEDSIGIVHFWGSSNKINHMKEYNNRLRETANTN